MLRKAERSGAAITPLQLLELLELPLAPLEDLADALMDFTANADLKGWLER